MILAAAGQVSRYIPVILAFGMESQEVHREFEVSLVWVVSSRPQSYKLKPRLKTKIKPNSKITKIEI